MNPIVSILLGMLPDVLKRVIPGETSEEALKRSELQVEMTKALMASEISQIETNKQEAAHDNIFVAGWRPFIGWVCGIGLAVSALHPILNWVLSILGLPFIPDINNENLNVILMGMLGLGGLRTVEKVQFAKASPFDLLKKK